MNEQSSAVLTPHLNHPNFFKRNSQVHTTAYKAEICVEPVSETVKKQRKQWCLVQLRNLESNLSNAVLGVSHEKA